MTFNDENFMLKNEPAKRLYQKVKDQPIFDFHCHLSPKEIYEDQVFEDIVDLWLGGDHYKWRLMRAYGVPEKEITGSSDKLTKFKAWAKTVSHAYGNPLYHWSHLELKNVFGITDLLTEENAEEMYHKLNQIIHDKKLSPRKLIQMSKVNFIGTTDHPLDNLVWHEKIAQDTAFHVEVAPTFRPDEVFVEHANFNEFISRLAEVTNQKIHRFCDVVAALEERVKYFVDHGCKASDISFGEVVFEKVSQAQCDEILKKRMSNQSLTKLEVRQWQSAIFKELCRLYHQYGLVTQVHFGALRNNHTQLYSKIGPDCGVDSMGEQMYLTQNLNLLLDDYARSNQLPKMIWYNLNPIYNIPLANTLANFQVNNHGIKSQLQYGAAWWFADTKLGMINQMETLAEQGMLANFVGMLTDSRSFLSYQRHDYFRRILCTLVGTWIEEEEVPADFEKLGQFVADICYDNALHFFKGEV